MVELRTTYSGFERAFCDAGLQDGFSAEALRALYNYFSEVEAECGVSLVADPIRICCEFTEYSSARQAAEDSGWHAPGQADDENDADYDDRLQGDAMTWLQHNTAVLPFAGGVVIQDF